MVSWILVYTFLGHNDLGFTDPIIIDSFNTRDQCEISLTYMDETFKKINVPGRGFCWAE